MRVLVYHHSYYRSNNEQASSQIGGAQEEEEGYSITQRPGLVNREFNVRELMYVITLNPRYINALWLNNFHVLI